MLSFSMVSFANQSAMGTQQQTMTEKKMDHKEKALTYKGEVATVDPTAHTIVVKGKEGEKTFDVSQAIVKGKAEPDHYVTVKYTDKDGKMVASSVKVSSHRAAHRAAGNMKQGSIMGSSEYAGIGQAATLGLKSECC